MGSSLWLLKMFRSKSLLVVVMADLAETLDIVIAMRWPVDELDAKLKRAAGLLDVGPSRDVEVIDALQAIVTRYGRWGF